MRIETDFLVIGSGMAGLWFAHRVGTRGKVTVLTKKDDSDTNTNYAQGGIAAALGSDDSPEAHLKDTMKAGYGLCNQEALKIMVTEGPGLVTELDNLDIDFTEEEGHLQLTIEGGHTRRRVAHAADTTGQAIEWGLIRSVRSNPNITIYEHHYVIDLLIDANGNCCGAMSFDHQSGQFTEVYAPVVLMASGGLCRLYEHTTNPPIATGDGVAMAWRAGAKIANLEFIQFHPTSLYGYKLDGRAFLVTEAVRGEGGLLKTPNGERFMPRYHPDAEMAPRSVVARAIYNELRNRRLDYVLLDLSPIPDERIHSRFPMIADTCKRFGLDITSEPIPVVPAAHYSVGGIHTDTRGRSSVPGLFAAGEVACTGVHGANRLASNSLLEALVFADRAAKAALEGNYPPSSHPRPRERQQRSIADPSLLNSLISTLKQTMWRYAGIVRSESQMEKGRKRISDLTREFNALYPPGAFSPRINQLRNRLTVGDLILRSALSRKESRGLHYVVEYPDLLDNPADTILDPE